MVSPFPWCNSRRRLHLIVVALMFLGVIPQSLQAEIHAVCREAVRGNRLEKTELLGFSITRTPFSEASHQGGLLVGFDVALRARKENEIAAIRPVYRTPSGATVSRSYGKFTGSEFGLKKKTVALRVLRLRARDGYAVGGLKMRTAISIRGLQLIYMKVSGDRLDPRSAYLSSWIGSSSEGREVAVRSEGAPVVGVFGGTDSEHVLSLGLIKANIPAPASPPVKQKPLVTRQPEKKPLPKPENPQPQPNPEPNPPPVVVEKKQPLRQYRDAHLCFRFDIPQGWREMSAQELSLINEFVARRFPTNKINYDMGFRHGGSAMGSFPYILLQTKELTEKASYDQIERIISSNFVKNKIKRVESTLKDLCREITVGNAVLDRKRNQIVMRLQMELPDGSRAQAVSITHIGAKGLASVHCYSSSEHFDRDLVRFVQINDSFAFDEGCEYVAPPDVRMDIPWKSLLPVGVFLGVSAAIGVPVWMMQRKKRSAKSRNENSDQPDKASTSTKALRSSATDPNGITTKPTTEQPNWLSELQAISTAKKITPQPVYDPVAEQPRFLTAVTQYTLESNRNCRIYLMKSDLLILDLGAVGNPSMGVGFAVGGLVGAAVAAFLSNINKVDGSARENLMDSADGAMLMRLAEEGGKNYRFSLDDIRNARLEPPSFLDGMGGKVVGMLILRHRDKGEWRFHFMAQREMQDAIELLPDLLGERLEINAELDRRTWQYKKKLKIAD